MTNTTDISTLKAGNVQAKDPKDTVRELLIRARPIIAESLPKHLDATRLTRVALNAINTTPKLLECYVPTLVGAVMQAAQLGLEVNTPRGEAYLVPFWNSRKRRSDVQLIPGYRGLIDLARRSGGVRGIEAAVVYALDKFDCRMGSDPSLSHEPFLDGPPGEKRLAYAIARFSDGGWQFELMPAWKIDDIKARSKSRDKEGKLVGPWITDEDEMWRKTVVRRLCKYLPMSVELARAVQLSDAGEAGQPQGLDRVLAGDFAVDPEPVDDGAPPPPAQPDDSAPPA